MEMVNSDSRKKNNEAVLDVEEFGILLMTCSSKINDQSDSNKEIIYTSKESYLWVPIISYLVRETNISSNDRKIFLELALDAITSHHRAKWSNRVQGLAVVLDLINSMLFYCTREKFKSPIFYDPALFGASIEDIIERLHRLGLIEEQFNQPISNSAFNVFGFVPLGFTLRTKLGENMLEKLNSMMMFYAKKEIVEESDFDIHYKYYTTWLDFLQIIKNFNISDYKVKRRVK